AAVHCVIVGVGMAKLANPRLFDYEKPDSEPHELGAKTINPYLVDAAEIFLTKRMMPISDAPAMVFGSKAVDFGYLMLDDAQRDELVAGWPVAESWIRPCLVADDFLNGRRTWCLWLRDASPDQLRKVPPVLERVDAVRGKRLESKK